MKSFEVQEFRADSVPSFLKEGCIIPLKETAQAPSFWIGWGNSWQSASSDPANLSVYAPDFFLKEAKSWRIFPNSARISLKDLTPLLDSLAEVDSAPRSPCWEKPALRDFEEMFSELQARFDTSSLKKAVPVIFSRSSEKLSPSQISGMLRRGLQTASEFPIQVYGFWNSQEGMLGATPELLFHQANEKELSTVALAGTRPHSATLAERKALLEDTKELEEHRYVVDGIASSFANWGKISIGQTRELRLQKFSHLMTPISLAPNSAHPFEEITRILHPTPALGAWPKDEGMQWLESLQRFGDRRRFGAPFGAIGKNGERICWVAIRGVQWDENGSQIGAGCGVTVQSELQREWQELGLKLDSTRAALGL